MRLLILADIHANLSALKSVIQQSEMFCFDKVVLLGDLIDYGMRPNETIEFISGLENKIICNIWGNHEKAIMEKKYSRFSSQRGEDFSKYTESILSESSQKYILEKMNKEGFEELILDNKKILIIHGSLEDVFWKSILSDKVTMGYESYDYVISGHSHRPHFFEKYYKGDNVILRNEKKTVFINPGSVGQPRNHICNAQYCILDTNTGEIQFLCSLYDINEEQKLYNEKVDKFYQQRLIYGI